MNALLMIKTRMVLILRACARNSSYAVKAAHATDAHFRFYYAKSCPIHLAGLTCRAILQMVWIR